MGNYISTACLSNIPRWDEHTSPALLASERDRECAGFVPRDYDLDPVASHRCARGFREPKLSVQEQKELIREREAKGLTNLAIFTRLGFPPLHQWQTSLCWMNATVDDLHWIMAYNGLPILPLSPASAAAPITGFRDEGGNVSQATHALCDLGVVEQRLWPANAINRKYDTELADANRKRHRVDEYDDLDPRDFDQMVTMLLLVGPVPYGNYSMGHAVLAMDPVIDERGEIGILARNSGYLRDKNGLSLFFGAYKRPDDACCIRTITVDSGEENQ